MGDSGEADVSVLVVDDGKLNRRLAERFFQHLGCSVRSVEDAGSAIQEIGATEYDLVVTDIQMPDMDGTEATPLFRKAATESAPSRARPLFVIAMSGAALGHEREAYVEAGFDDYLPKPLSIEAIRELLEHWKTGAPPTHAG